MTDWQITATTIFCEDVDDEVTLIGYSDGTIKCTGQLRYLKPDKNTLKDFKIKKKQKGLVLGCRDNCKNIHDYHDKWFSK